MRVLVCGGRDYHDSMTLGAWLGGLDKRDHITAIIEGGATGADRLARAFGEWRGIVVHSYPVDTKIDGPWPAAGPRRNQRMLNASRPDLVMAFPGGRGTADMVRRARAAGVEVIEVTEAIPEDAQP